MLRQTAVRAFRHTNALHRGKSQDHEKTQERYFNKLEEAAIKARMVGMAISAPTRTRNAELEVCSSLISVVSWVNRWLCVVTHKSL